MQQHTQNALKCSVHSGDTAAIMRLPLSGHVCGERRPSLEGRTGVPTNSIALHFAGGDETLGPCITLRYTRRHFRRCPRYAAVHLHGKSRAGGGICVSDIQVKKCGPPSCFTSVCGYICNNRRGVEKYKESEPRWYATCLKEDRRASTKTIFCCMLYECEVFTLSSRN